MNVSCVTQLYPLKTIVFLVITVHQAIPIMFGAEMGASIMNALISLTQSGDRSQFRRAFAAATMNDIYNFLCYLVFLPLEIIAG